jgi:hypothetical protein
MLGTMLVGSEPAPVVTTTPAQDWDIGRKLRTPHPRQPRQNRDTRVGTTRTLTPWKV